MKRSLLVAAWIVLEACTLVKANPAADEAIEPKDQVITLFNGRDLTGLYAWIVDTKYDDPRKVFAVHDGLLQVSGDGYGYVATREMYKNYRLITEFKWGPRTWGNRQNRSKDSGIVVHCTGPDGSSGNWMAGIESQIIQGGCGDLLVVGGKYADGSSIPLSLTCELKTDSKGQIYKDLNGVYWKRGGTRQTFHAGRINWYARDSVWKDELGFRGKDDVESPDGEWNRMEVVCDGGHIVIYLNGVQVNEGFDSQPAFGKILFQTEMAEIFFRKMELWPLPGKGSSSVK